MVERIGNIHQGGERIAEYVLFDNGMAAVSYGRYAEQLVPKSVHIYNTWDELFQAYSPGTEFRPFFDRQKQKKKGE